MSLLNDPQIVAAVISFATVGVELGHRVWCRRRRTMRGRGRWSLIVEVDVHDAGAACLLLPCQRVEVAGPRVLIIKDPQP